MPALVWMVIRRCQELTRQGVRGCSHQTPHIPPPPPNAETAGRWDPVPGQGTPQGCNGRRSLDLHSKYTTRSDTLLKRPHSPETRGFFTDEKPRAHFQPPTTKWW